jgi:MoxR-like ATPase
MDATLRPSGAMSLPSFGFTLVVRSSAPRRESRTKEAMDTVGPKTHEAALLENALFEIKKVIVGQDRAIERVLVCLLARGHCLLEGVPGLAKTLLVETLASVAGGTFARLQFTPDLLPADIVGTRIYRASDEKFDVELGPVFVNFVLADEINRAPAKVQSALLEVMAEHQDRRRTRRNSSNLGESRMPLFA